MHYKDNLGPLPPAEEVAPEPRTAETVPSAWTCLWWTFARPLSLMRSFMFRPRWVLPWLAISLVSVGTYWLLWDVEHQTRIERIEFNSKISEDTRIDLLDAANQATIQHDVAIAAAVVPLVWLLYMLGQSLLLWAFGRSMRGAAPIRGYLAVVAHSTLPFTLFCVASVILGRSLGTMLPDLSLTRLLSAEAHRALSSLDWVLNPFGAWFFILLVLGAGQINGWDRSRTLNFGGRLFLAQVAIVTLLEIVCSR